MEEIDGGEFPCVKYLTVQTEALEQMFYGESPTVYVHDGQYYLATDSQIVLLNPEMAQQLVGENDNQTTDSVYESDRNINVEQREMYELQQENVEGEFFRIGGEAQQENELLEGGGVKDLSQFICHNELVENGQYTEVKDDLLRIEDGDRYVEIKGVDDETRLIKISGDGFVQLDPTGNGENSNDYVFVDESRFVNGDNLIAVNSNHRDVSDRRTDSPEENEKNDALIRFCEKDETSPIQLDGKHEKNALIELCVNDLNSGLIPIDGRELNGNHYVQAGENVASDSIEVGNNYADRVDPEIPAEEYDNLTDFRPQVKTEAIDANKYQLITLNELEEIQQDGGYEIIPMENDDSAAGLEEGEVNADDYLADLVVGKNLVTGKTVTLHKYLEKMRKGKRKPRKEEETHLPIETYSVGNKIYKILDIRKDKKLPDEYNEIVGKTLTSLMDMESIRKRFENSPLMIRVNEMEGERQTARGEINGCMMKNDADEWTFVNFRDQHHAEIVNQLRFNFRCQSHVCATVVLFRYMGKLKTMKVHQSTEKKANVCIVCFKELTSSRTLFKHYATHHDPSLLSVYTCDICDKHFTNKATYKRHQAVHDESLKSLECTACEKRFTDLTTLKRHLLFHTGIKIHRCEICDRTFTLVGDLNAHRKTHFGIYECDVCGRKFSRQGNMLRHASIHNGEHKCHICGSSYHHMSTLTRHMMQEHVDAIKT